MTDHSIERGITSAIEEQMLKITALVEALCLRHEATIRKGNVSKYTGVWTRFAKQFTAFEGGQTEAAKDYLRKHPDAKLSVVRSACEVSKYTASKARKALRAEKLKGDPID